MMTTTKANLVSVLVANGLDPLKAAESIDLALGAIVDSLKAGNRVELRDFGVFEVKARAEKVSGLNGAIIPACNVVKFKPGKNVASAIA